MKTKFVIVDLSKENLTIKLLEERIWFEIKNNNALFFLVKKMDTDKKGYFESKDFRVYPVGDDYHEISFLGFEHATKDFYARKQNK